MLNHIDQVKINRFEELQAVIKVAEKELSTIKAEFIALGGGESDNHVVVIKDNFRESVAAKDVFASKFGPTWLADQGLIKLSAYNTVVVSLKSTRKVG